MIDKRFLALAAPLALAACGGKSAAPSGQVLATVDGQEITAIDLDNELGGASAPTPEAQKNLQRMALENIVNRMILANAAEKEGLAKGPQAAVIERKAKQLALVELLNRKLAKSIPAPSAEEVDTFVSDNPLMFSQRKIYVVDQIIVPQITQAAAQALQPTKTLAEAQSVLAANKLQSNSTVGVIDSLTLPPEAARQISAMPPDEVFIIPANGGVRVNHIRSSQVDPISGDQAKAIAREILSRQRGQQSMQAAMAEMIKKGHANVKYNAEFAPPPEGAKPAPNAAGAPAAK